MEKYVTPELEITVFEHNDIITSSGYVADPNEDSNW